MINNKVKQIHFRCSEKEKEEIEKMAKDLNLSVSQLILFCLREGSSYNNLKKCLKGLEKRCKS